MFSWLLLLLLIAFFTTVNSKECLTRSYIEKSLLNAHIPGAVMMVVNSTDILYQEAFGHQSFLPTELMDVEKSIFVLASISKTFIAIAVMQMVESKQLDLDQDINQYLFSSDAKISHPLYPTHRITLRQLLSHSTSIGPNSEIESQFFRADDRALTETTLTEACFTYLTQNVSNWLPHPPGTVTHYSNVGSALVALIVERVAKISYEQYIREKILRPIGIDVKNAAFRLSDIEDQKNLVKHYAYSSSEPHDWNKSAPNLNITQSAIPNWLSIPFYSVSIYPAGLLRMSAYSLSKYLRMFMNNGSSLVRPQSIVQMQTPVNVFNPDENVNTTNNNSSISSLEFGIIWYWQTFNNGRRFLGHGGSMPGALHSMLINEKGDRGVIILTNADASANNNVTVGISLALGNIQFALFDCFEK